MRNVWWSVGAVVLAAGLALPVRSEVDPHSLTDVSDKLLSIYNTGDAQALHALLSSPLQEAYSVEALRDVLKRCRVLTHEIFRFSTPVWGGRHYGFFAVYAETSTFEMILEIDENEKLLHWVITDDVTAARQQCIVNKLTTPTLPDRNAGRQP